VLITGILALVSWIGFVSEHDFKGREKNALFPKGTALSEHLSRGIEFIFESIAIVNRSKNL